MITISTLRNAFHYREFIFSNVKREFQSKYHGSILGVTWSVLSPLAMIVVYTVVFSQLMKSRIPGVDSAFGYSIYLCTGILTWGLFAEITSRAQGIFLDNANLIKKINFPRICLPIIVVMNAALNFAIIFGLFLIFLIVSGNFPGWAMLSFIPILLLQMLFAISLGIILGVLNVFFRDVGQFFSILLQFWFWLTPVVYPVDVLPETLQKLLKLNPMAEIIMAYHKIFVMGQMPQWHALIPAVATTLILCILALQLFRKRAGEMVDEL